VSGIASAIDVPVYVIEVGAPPRGAPARVGRGAFVRHAGGPGALDRRERLVVGRSERGHARRGGADRLGRALPYARLESAREAAGAR